MNWKDISTIQHHQREIFGQLQSVWRIEKVFELPRPTWKSARAWTPAKIKKIKPQSRDCDRFCQDNLRCKTIHPFTKNVIYMRPTGNPQNTKTPELFVQVFSGGTGIRTPGPVTVNSFQDCRNRPLCHSSSKMISHFQWCKYKELFYTDQIFLWKIS